MMMMKTRHLAGEETRIEIEITTKIHRHGNGARISQE